MPSHPIRCVPCMTLMSREKAKCIDPSKPAYDVLLDGYEKGMTSARLDQIFTQASIRQGGKRWVWTYSPLTIRGAENGCGMCVK